jgi:hypothetical protein
MAFEGRERRMRNGDAPSQVLPGGDDVVGTVTPVRPTTPVGTIEGTIGGDLHGLFPTSL